MSNDWNQISSQLKVDKVYIEAQRNRELASDELVVVERIIGQIEAAGAGFSAFPFRVAFRRRG